MTKILICGSRSISDTKFINQQINLYLKELSLDIKEVVIIEGGARGVDTIAKYWAMFNNIPYEEYPADWNKYGKSAGIVRNKIMVENANYVLILWDGKSKGTKNDIDLCKKLNKPYKLVEYN